MAFTMIYNGEVFTANVGIKGSDHIRLLNGDDVIFEATGVSDFSLFEVAEGEWETPVTKVVATVNAGAAVENGAVILTLPKSVRVESGLIVNFNAPCDCSAVSEGLVIDDVTYSVVDAMNRVVTGNKSGGVWGKGSQVSVILNTENQKAYIQNPATSASSGTAGSQTQMVSYVGKTNDGTRSDPILVNFAFTPTFVMVVDPTKMTPVVLPKVSNSNVTTGAFTYKIPGNYVELYSSDGEEFNTSGTTYHFIAVG